MLIYYVMYISFVHYLYNDEQKCLLEYIVLRKYEQVCSGMIHCKFTND